MSKQNQWIAGINAVSAALQNDAEHVREVLLEAGAKNPRIQEIESQARRMDIPVRRVAQQDARHNGVLLANAILLRRAGVARG